MAFIPYHPLPDSPLDLLVKWLRRKTMSDWLKLAITLLGFGVLTWSSVQKLEYRVDKIETTLEQHLDKHEMQYDSIQKSLRDIEIQLTRLQK
jgi:hypothetical protein